MKETNVLSNKYDNKKKIILPALVGYILLFCTFNVLVSVDYCMSSLFSIDYGTMDVVFPSLYLLDKAFLFLSSFDNNKELKKRQKI